MSTTSTGSRATRYLRLGLRVLLTALFLLVSVTKVLQFDFMMTNMAELHFFTLPTVVIGIIELAAAVMLWLPRWRTLALSVLLLIMAGSAGAHWGFGHPVSEVVPSFVVATLVFALLWLERGRALWQFVVPTPVRA